MHSTTEAEYLASCCTIARAAGAKIMPFYQGVFTTRHKDDHSPVTDADLAANLLIVTALAKLTPDIPIIAEEDETLNPGGHARFWLVDPLDGTRSFVRGEAEFTVNIALIEDGMPKLGVIYAPPQQALYYGSSAGAFRQTGDEAAMPIHVRPAPADGLTIVRSRSQPSARTNDFLATLTVKELRSSSSSIKFCHVAEGSADCYPRFGRTMEWDTAAGHAILLAAGGRVETLDGQPLSYGKPGFENPAFVAFGG